MAETDKIDERMRHIFEVKRNENYSQAYYFSVGLMKLLHAQEFPADEQQMSAAGFKDRWLAFSNEL